MSDGTDKSGETNEKPDLVGKYRPVAIRSVVAAHAMIPRSKGSPAAEPAPMGEMGFSLPNGFHNPPED